MTTTGPVSPTTAVNDQTAGSNAWSNPGNILNHDGTSTSVSVDSYYLLIGGFENDGDVSAIPDDDTLDGLLLELDPDADSNDELDIVQVKHGGSYVGDNKGPVNVASGHDVDGHYPVSVGGSSDDWGLTLTGADIKDGTFKIGFRVTDTGIALTKRLDHARVTFYHGFHGVPVLQDVKVRVVGLDDAQVY